MLSARIEKIKEGALVQENTSTQCCETFISCCASHYDLERDA